MERITLYIRTTKTAGKIKLRFRLTEGRAVQLFHKSQIEADLADLKKFDIDGSLKPRVTIYNEELRISIIEEIDAIRTAYRELKTAGLSEIATDVFEERIDMILNPDKYNLASGKCAETLLSRFDRYVKELTEYKTVSESRLVQYRTFKAKMTRFLTIFKKTSYLPKDFKPEDILGLREFLLNEYKFVEKYPLLYNQMDRRTLPQKPMHPNSVTLTLRVLSTFFNELENNDEILKSPFRRLSKTRRQNVLSEHYDEPYSLTREEFMTIMNTEVPEDLKEVKDAFLLQCALGCRISDFMRMDMSNVSVSDEGIPYVHYVAKKTTNTSSGRKEKTTPLMLFALDIIKRYDFRFPMFYNCTYGKLVYNKKIKNLFVHCKIDRLISRYDEATQKMNQTPLYRIASNKLCRKTHIDIANKVQINMYATGLHEVGSSAVGHYSKLQIQDLFVLLCLAFNQPQYKVDKDLNVISGKTGRK
ncbi:MAG: hypothetical protein NC193_03430 [bacterium]|nr:hypothetical protein [bacterium]